MKVQNGSFLSIEQLQNQYLNQSSRAKEAGNEQAVSFLDILNRKQAEQLGSPGSLKFSRHAVNRLSDRNIELTSGQIERLTNGAKKAGEKGIQESLVIVDELAFIVNIPNKTVVTAMNQTDTEDSVFTNIDGAVIM